MSKTVYMTMNMDAFGLNETATPPDAVAQYRVIVTEPDGKLVIFSTHESMGGVGFKISDSGALVVHEADSDKLILRAYSPVGWRSAEFHSTEGKPRRVATSPARVR